MPNRHSWLEWLRRPRFGRIPSLPTVWSVERNMEGWENGWICPQRLVGWESEDNRMSEVHVKDPWPKVQFKTESGSIHDGYLYYILGDSFYISQNNRGETMGLVENWVIHWRNIIKFYDEKYGLKCTCGTGFGGAYGVGRTHTLTCGWSTINTDLM